MSVQHLNEDISHPLWIRISHWLNAFAVIIMISSGWRIYNASPIFSFSIPPQIALGGWLGGALQWHFAAMWLLFFNGCFYIFMNILTGRFKKKYWPLSYGEFIHDVGQTLRFRLSHDDLNKYNMIQKIMYLGVILLLVMIVLSGLAVWKSVQFPLLNTLMGGYDNARIVHFICMGLIVAFIFIHVLLSLIVPRTLKGIIFGRF